MEGAECRREVRGEPDELAERKRATRRDLRLQRAPLDVPAREVVAAADLSCIQDGNQVRVLDLAGHPRLALEAAAVGLVVRELLPEQLESDVLAVALGAKDDAYGALAEPVPQTVLAEHFAPRHHAATPSLATPPV